MKTIIHVNQAVIAKNRKEGTNEPPIIVRNYKGSTNCHEVTTTGPCRFVYRPHNPLDCGARLWAETNHPVHIHGQQPVTVRGETEFDVRRTRYPEAA